MDLASPSPTSALLANADFLHRLAASLAGAAADDLTQEVLLRASVRPPRGDSRSWFVAVAKNLWRNQSRGERRRRRREAALVAPEPAPSVAEVAAHEELRRRVVDAVQALPEPLRQVVVLRYYEGLDSPSMAARLGISASTVRTRHQQAVAELRRRLDTAHDGRREAWLLPLLRWHGLEAPARQTLGMLALVAAMLVAVGVGWIWFARAGEPTPTSATASPGLVVGDVARPATQGEPVQEQMPLLREAVAAIAAPSGYPWQRPDVRLQGIVVHADGSPATDFAVSVRSVALDSSTFVGIDEHPKVEHALRSGADGRFAISALPWGRYEIEALGPEDRHAFVRADLRTQPREVRLIAVAKPRRGQIEVRVVDAESRPVAKAAVRLAVRTGARGIGWEGRSPLVGATDGTGRWQTVRPEGDRIQFVAASVRDDLGRVGVVHMDCATKPLASAALDVVLHPPGSIVGRLDGLPSYRDVEVRAHCKLPLDAPELLAFPGVVAADGQYRIDGLPPGKYKIQIAGRVRRADNEQFWNTAATTVVAGGVADAVPPVLNVVAGGELSGRVLDANGKPLAAAEVTARRPWFNNAGGFLNHHRNEASEGMFFLHSRTRTDAAGQYSLRLPPGSWQLVVTAPGCAMDVRFDVDVRAESHQRFEHQLSPDGALAGSAPTGCTLRLAAQPSIVHSIGSQFWLRGLVPGVWELGTDDGGEAGPTWVPVTIEAGKTTWIDLLSTTRRSLRGRLLHRGQPLAGYEVAVDAGMPRFATDAAGAFLISDVVARKPSLQIYDRGLHIGSVDRAEGDIELEGRFLTISTLGPDGEAEPAKVAIGDTYGGTFDKYKPHGGPGALECPDGSLRLLLMQRSELTTVVATFRDGSRARAVLGDADVVQLRRPATGTVAARVVDAAGQPCSGRLVRALAWGHASPPPTDPAQFVAGCADAQEWVQGATDGDGGVELRGLPAGFVLVESWSSGDHRRIAATLATVVAGQRIGVVLVP